MTSTRVAALAVRGGDPAVNLRPPAWPVVGRRDEQRMGAVVRSGKWSWLGRHEQAFCRDFAEFVGARYCLGLCNGTVTLQCALQAVGVVPGDEVIVPALTWVATAQAAMDIGATVVFADVDAETLNLDPESLRKAITRRTRAVIPVHLYGCMCDMDAVMRLARRHKLRVVEDVAHQHGSVWKNKGAGAIGDAGSFSFQQSKVLTCGEGGAVTTNNLDVYRTVFALKQVGWAPRHPRQDLFGDLVPAKRYGHNYRLNELQAVLLRGGLSRLAAQTATRERRVAQITECLQTLDGPLRAARRDRRVTRQAYYAMTLVYDPDRAGGLHRDGFVHALRAEGVPVGYTYPPVYRSPLLNLYDRTSPVPFRDPATTPDYRACRMPNAERAVNDTAVLLPQTALLGNGAYARQLIQAIRKVTDNLSEARSAWEDAVRRKRRRSC